MLVIRKRGMASIVCFALAAAAGFAPANGHGQFSGDSQATEPVKRAQRTMRMELIGNAKLVFPLFGPVRESEWDPNWKPAMLFPVDGSQSADGAVFTVPDPGAQNSVWVMSRYDAARRQIQYVRFIPGAAVVQIDIGVEPAGRSRSLAMVRYTYTSLSSEGDGLVDRFVETFPKREREWKKVINHYLTTGTPLVH